MVCPRPESSDTPRALVSVTLNLCCDETEPRSIHSPDSLEIHLLHSQRANLARGLKMHKSRTLKVPRRNARQENPDQTLAHDISFSPGMRRCKNLGS